MTADINETASMFDRHHPADYRQIAGSDEFPWGELNPESGFEVGDFVGLVYSDHEEYVFDNPIGFVVAIEDDDRITVEVSATIGAERVFLKARRRQA